MTASRLGGGTLGLLHEEAMGNRRTSPPLALTEALLAMSAEPRITLQVAAILTVLMEDPVAEHYGLAIAKRAELPTGSVYPILARLERAGWVMSDWEDIDERVEGRRRRRYYKLTSAGAEKTRDALAKTARVLVLRQVPRTGLPGVSGTVA